MLFILMHNNDNYLREVLILIKKENITDVKILSKEGVGSLIAGGQNYIMSMGKGQILPEYNKALISVIDSKERLDYILNLIEEDDYLKLLNADEKGYLCTIPMERVIRKKEMPIPEEKGNYSVSISDYLKENMICTDLRKDNKDDVILELGNIICKNKKINNQRLFLKDVYKREKLASTGIGNEIALPHARTDSVDEFIIAFGRSKNGIEFESIDNKKVKLIFLMGTPKASEHGKFLQLLAKLSRLLKKKHFRDELLKANNEKEIIKVFQDIER